MFYRMIICKLMYSNENQRTNIMKTKILFITSLLLIVGCSKEPINYETTLVEREGVFYTNDTNEPYSGKVFSLYLDGKKKDEGTLKDGRMISRTEWSWFENGQKMSEETFKDGKLDGLSTEWYENGQKKFEEFYRDSLLNGLVKYWYENGQKEFEGTYKNGKQDGLYTVWYENGQKKYESTYKNGKEDGFFTMWYESGQKNIEGTYKNGKYISSKSWNKDGSVEN